LSAVAHIKEYKTGKLYSDAFRGGLSWNGYERNVLLRNDGADANGVPHFTDVAVALGADDIRDARGMATADFDNDGDLDIVINNNPGDMVEDQNHARATFLRNNLGQNRSFLAVELEGTQSNRDGVGAMVTIEAGGIKQLRHAAAGSGYASQHSARLYFGLNDATRVDTLTVRWPSGLIERFENIEARRLIHITEGSDMKVLTLPQKRSLAELSTKAATPSPNEGRGPAQ
jgi:ASPIC and UnbV/FG-GAP-like repeat